MCCQIKYGQAALVKAQMCLGRALILLHLCRATAEDMLAAYSSMMQAVSLDLDRPSASYNCWFTTDLGMLATRTQEKDGPCSINTLGFAGTVLVKSDQDMDYIVQKGCMEVLRSVGVPWTA